MKFTFVEFELSDLAELRKHLRYYDGGLKYFYFNNKLYKVDNYVVVKSDNDATGLGFRKINIDVVSSPHTEPNYNLYIAFNLGGKIFPVKNLIYEDNKLVCFTCSAGGKYKVSSDNENNFINCYNVNKC